MSPRRKAVLLSALLAAVSVPALFGAGKKASSCVYPTPACRIVDPATAFADPTATCQGRVTLGPHVYVAPFAVLNGSRNPVSVGDSADVQDSVQVDATNGEIKIESEAILAHGATVKGGAHIGAKGNCSEFPHQPRATCPSFVGFNAEVDGATIEQGAMVGHLARVGPGRTIHSGRKVMSGMNVQTAEDEVKKTEDVKLEDREFMDEVVHVNSAFAKQYAALAAKNSTNVCGINYNPDTPPFNPGSHLPTLGGVRQPPVPDFPNRIIGELTMTDSLNQLESLMGTDEGVSLRADEGHPFVVGSIAKISNNVTFHALEDSHLHLGAKGKYGPHSIVHGGELPTDRYTTATGNNVTLGAYSVFFRSTIGDNSTIGEKSLVQDSKLPPNTVVPPHEVWLDGKFKWKVEW